MTNIGRITGACSLLLLAALVPAAAQDERPLIISGGTLIDGNGGEPISNAMILVRGNRIEAVGTEGSIPVPGNAEIIDARGKWVLPGLWDNYGNYSWFFGEAMLRQGITSFVDIGNGEELSIAHRNAVNAGKIRGPRTWIAIGHFGDVAPEDLTGYETELSTRQLPQNVEDARARTRRLLDAGADIIQFHETEAFSREIIVAACEEAHARNVPCSVRANGPEMYATEAARAGVDLLGRARGVEREIIRDGASPGNHLLEIFAEMDDEKARAVIDVLVAEDVYLIPNIVHFLPGYQRDWARMDEAAVALFTDPDLRAYYPEDFYEEMREVRTDIDAGEERARRMPGYQNLLRFYRMFDEAGGKTLVGGGTNGGKPPGLVLNDEMEAFQEAGIPQMHILQSATKWNAEAMRKLDIVGTVEPGKLADLLIVGADPLADIAHLRNIDKVIMNGAVVDRAFRAWYDTPFRGSGEDIRVVEDLSETVELMGQTFAEDGAAEIPDPNASPEPGILSLTPFGTVEGSPSLTLRLTGFNFVRRMRVYFGGISVPWRRLSATELELTIGENLLRRVGRYEIVIVNPPPMAAPELGDGTSNIAHFIVDFRYAD